MQVSVECQVRPEGSKPRALRREGILPATLYGHNGTESVSLALDTKEAQNLLKKASVNNTLIDLKVPEINWNGKALIREVQAHPWKKTLYHLSFFSVASQDSVEVTVPLHLIGESVGAKKGGILEQMITEISVQCAPDSIPESVDINIDDMEIGATLKVSDLVLPDKINAVGDVDRVVFSIIAPAKITEEVSEEEEQEDTPEE